MSRFNIWTNQSASYSMIADIAARCSSDDTGDLLSWKAFESTTGDNVFKQSPSECDGTCTSFFFSSNYPYTTIALNCSGDILM